MFPDPDLPQYASKLNSWAMGERLIQRVFIFGSRVRGNHTSSSDIDIAVELPYSDRNENLAHFQFEQLRWVNELSKILKHEVDVQLFEINHRSIVHRGVSENSVLAYDRRC